MPEPGEEGPRRPRGVRVLVMDDEDSVRTVVCRMLERIGYDAEGASDGREAVEIYARARQDGRPFAAVILDMTVPGGLGGAATLTALKALDPEVRAVASSGYDSETVKEGSQAQGFVAVLVKPYTVAELVAAMAGVAGPP